MTADDAHDVKEDLPTPSPLRDYQWQGVAFLSQNEGALLADEMGLGKTVQAAVALRVALRKQGLQRALIVAPVSLIPNWERELERWAPELVVRRVQGERPERRASYILPIEVLVASYDQIRSDALDLVPRRTFDLVVLDEAQRIKNRESLTAFACRLLSRRRAWALTGTPVENRREDLESIFEFLCPGLVERRLPRAQLLERIGPHFLRRRKRDVLSELPPVIVQDVEIMLMEKQRAAYDAIWLNRDQLASATGRPATTTTLFALLTRLKQLCNFDPTTGESAKFEALSTVLDGLSSPEDKVLIFSQYVETLRWLSARMTIPHDLFHGGLGGEERERALDVFQTQSGPRALLVSLKAGGVGLNLQAASSVVLFDRWWNPAIESQAMYRAHRFDRKTPLHVMRFLVRDSVEERIQSILTSKQVLFDQYVESAATTDVPSFTRHDLLRALGLSDEPTDSSGQGESRQ